MNGRPASAWVLQCPGRNDAGSRERHRQYAAGAASVSSPCRRPIRQAAAHRRWPRARRACSGGRHRAGIRGQRARRRAANARGERVTFMNAARSGPACIVMPRNVVSCSGWRRRLRTRMRSSPRRTRPCAARLGERPPPSHRRNAHPGHAADKCAAGRRPRRCPCAAAVTAADSPAAPEPTTSRSQSTRVVNSCRAATARAIAGPCARRGHPRRANASLHRRRAGRPRRAARSS